MIPPSIWDKCADLLDELLGLVKEERVRRKSFPWSLDGGANGLYGPRGTEIPFREPRTGDPP